MASSTAPVSSTLGRRRLRPVGADSRAVVIACRLALPAILLIAWAVAASSSRLVPSIGATADSFVDGFVDGWIVSPLLDSLKAVVLGFLIATMIAVPAGVVLGRSPFLGAVFDPIISALFAVPRIILYPVLLAAVGVGLGAKVWMAVISAVFPIALNTIAGTRGVSPTLVKLGRSLASSRLQMATRIYLPAALPAVMVGIRIGLSISFVSVIISELFAAKNGLGLLVQQAYGLQQYPKMFAVVVLIALIAFCGNLVLWSLERRVQSRNT